MVLRARAAAAALALASAPAACSDDPAPAAMQAPGAGAGSEAGRVLGPFLAGHWQLPVPPQGPAPAGFTDVEASLDPATCGACHPEQYAQWETSLHAGAFSPGFAGQLVEGELAEPAQVRQCQTCHAPLAEQQPHDAALQPNPELDADLRARGIACAACHVRAHRHFGPPRRPELAPPAGAVPHGGFEARTEFLDSRFCAPCHQFFDDPGVNGKPLENTYAEWRASPQAAAGRHCQDCHMPDRAHLWRGIHDPDMVRGAVDVELVAFDVSGAELAAALVLRNTDVGHAFPTYVTPRVLLSAYQVDAAGREIDGTRVEAQIARRVDLARMVELSDTRVLPGESVRLDYARPRAPGAAALAGVVTVDPDHHYRGLFESLLPTLQSDAARAQIAEAHRRTLESSYVLAEVRVELEAPPG